MVSIMSGGFRYKQDIKAEDKQRLKAVVKEHAHYLVTAEIKRELGQGLSRCVRVFALNRVATGRVSIC